jgi:hypothetical protein
MGYLPAFVLARSGYRMVVERPPLLGGLALLAGWGAASLSGAPLVDDTAAVATLRREQRERLRRLHEGAPVEPDRAQPAYPALKSR